MLAELRGFGRGDCNRSIHGRGIACLPNLQEQYYSDAETLFKQYHLVISSVNNLMMRVLESVFNSTMTNVKIVVLNY